MFSRPLENILTRADELDHGERQVGEVIGVGSLAVQDYTHSTAPNRRFADVVTQRILKSMLAGRSGPYNDAELESIARTCTERENAARKVEREMTKRIAAVAMSNQD